MIRGLRRAYLDGHARAGAHSNDQVSASRPSRRDAGAFAKTRRSNSATDVELVDRIRAGQRDAFDDLYERYADEVFSLCLFILGEVEIARAAAGTAFALVARTRLSPLRDPAQLRSWLLELARGSAQAWSGSPQARGPAVPPGATPAELFAEAPIVAAPTSLAEGLSRTFDRAASTTASTGSDKPARADVPSPAAASDRPGASDGSYAEATPSPAADAPANTMDVSRTIPAPRSRLGSPEPNERRNRPTVTLAASLLLAVAGVTTAMKWPTAPSEASAHFPETVLMASASSTDPDHPDENPGRSTGPVIIAPSAGIASPRQAGPIASPPAIRRFAPDAIRPLAAPPANSEARNTNTTAGSPTTAAPPPAATATATPDSSVSTEPPRSQEPGKTNGSASASPVTNPPGGPGMSV